MSLAGSANRLAFSRDILILSTVSVEAVTNEWPVVSNPMISGGSFQAHPGGSAEMINALTDVLFSHERRTKRCTSSSELPSKRPGD